MRKRMSIVSTGLLLFLSLPALAQENKLKPEEIIQKVVAKEALFRQVWQQYMYRQNVTFEILGPGDIVRERQEMAIEVIFTTDGKREKRRPASRWRAPWDILVTMPGRKDMYWTSTP